MRKRSIIKVINELPDVIKLDDLIEKLIIIEKIEVGLNDIKEGRVVSHQEVKKRIKKWSK